MPRHLGYIDTGDRVVIKNADNLHCGFGGTNLKSEHEGMRGKVTSNDGYGHCEVELDNGDIISCWNGKNLDYEY